MAIRSNGGGHGGRQSGSNWMDPGAVGNGRREADVVRTITQKMQAIASVANTSDQSATTVNQNLQNQVNAMNSAGNGWAITNHLNAFNGQATGAEVWYWAGNEEARKKAAEVSAAIAKALGIVDRGAKATTSLFVHRNTNSGVNVLLIEWCFIDNANDMRKLDVNIDQAVRAVMNVLGYNTSGGSTNGASNNSNNSKPKTHDELVAASAPVRQGNAIAKLDKFNVFEKGKARVAGWLVPNTPQGPIGSRAWVLIMEHGTNKELTRYESKGISRPDVKKAYGYQGGDALGFDVTFDTDWLKGKKIDVVFRRANQANGEGAVNDVRISDIFLTL
ncbi:N-acetylmuramoyl-L-alanine amidase [Enterococcus mundtii]|uniref:N-acetylmuramoyl-L-alanine amidase n=1 Tax=Enterococcus mundtii TaxID=53346 RepID=UPI001FB89E2C|nr:N-acetylmuramoyl-L-alanine amidase [Enterococcus mundtii]GKS56304.1 hypothetical protein EMLAB_29190 [Enterococcus mundtii]